MGFLVVSFYTIGTGYEQEAERLVRSLDSLGIEHDVQGVPSRMDWARNCGMKAGFVASMLAKHCRPVVWLDADAEVLRPLDLFENADFELGVYRRRETRLDRACGPWNSGTLYFGLGTEGLLKLWDSTCQASPAVWDQIALYAAHCSMGDAAPRTELIPESYCAVFDNVGRPDDPHVIHHQASRRLKRAAGLPTGASAQRRTGGAASR